MTNEQFELFQAEQLRVLATVVLTRRRDLTIGETKKGTGIDLHVNIDRDDRPMHLTFGIVLRGVVTATTTEEVNGLLAPTFKEFQGKRKFPYPVCVFFFTLRELHGFFSWLAEPVVIDGAPKFVHHTKARCADLTTEMLNRIVEQIVGWYDAVEAVLIA